MKIFVSNDISDKGVAPSVEFVRKPRTNYARSRVQPFQTRTQPRGSRLRACQKDIFDKLLPPGFSDKWYRPCVETGAAEEGAQQA